MCACVNRCRKVVPMEAKKYTEVYIAGKVYTLGGFEEEEYLQKVAAYVNSKVTELRGQQGFLKMNADYQNVLLNLNLADDVFKIRRQVAAAEKKLATQEKETYHVKHDMVGIQKKMDGAAQEIQSLQEALAQKDQALEDASAQLSDLHGELEDTREMLREAEAELEDLRQQLASMQGKFPGGDHKPKIVR